MNIAACRFGKIEIDGRTYTSDVIITPERVLDSWWRQEGHRLAVADLTDVVAALPDVLVIGTIRRAPRKQGMRQLVRRIP